jgi:molybdate transport system substrate-binding protein
MSRLPRVVTLALLLLAPLLTAAGSPAPAAARAAAKLTVFAAASMTDVLPKIADAWRKRGGREVIFSFDASSRLAKQIKEGAPADVFVSADEEWMDFAAKEALIEPKSRRDIAGNDLVVIVPSASTLAAKDAASVDYAALPKLALAGENVPAGKYAQAALTALGAWDEVKAKLIRGDNVRTVLGWVASGEAPAGVVYRTDALSAGAKVKVLAAFPASTHPAIVYPAAVVKASKAADAASAFLAFCAGADGRKLFEEAGFKAAPGA